MHRRPLLAALGALGLLVASCATYTVRRESVATLPALAPQLQGKVLAVEPTEVSFGSARLAIDLRDVHVSVNGQEIQLERRYLAKEEDDFLGPIGILDVDILTKAHTDPAKVGLFAQNLLIQDLGGGRDWKVGFMKGLGESNMGVVSSRPVEQDRSVYPPRDLFLDRDGPASLFKEVQPVASGERPSDADLVLRSELSLSSEVIQLLGTPRSSLPIDGTMPPSQGEYYLSLLGSYRFSLIDARSGAVIATEKTKAEFIDAPLIRRYLKIPANDGDAAAYAKYFRTVDLEPQAETAVALAFDSVMPLLAPYYINTYHSVKVQK